MAARGLGRGWHAATFVVAAFAVVYQLALVVQGHSPLAPELRPSTGEAVRRFFSYFTIQSNLLVAATTMALTLDPRPGGRLWQVARLASMVGITVTGLVHWFLLRPLLDLSGGSYLADKLLHVAVPLLAVVGWVAFGPRLRAHRADILPALAWPVLWLVATLALAPVVGWYPYPFLDVAERGLAAVLVTCLAIAVLFVGLCLAAVALDRRLAGRAARAAEISRPTR